MINYLTINGFGHSVIGRRRSTNEDAILVDNQRAIYAVFDGVGGSNAGEVASGLAAERLQTLLDADADKLSEMAENGTCDSVLIRYIEQLCQKLNDAIVAAATDDPSYAGMGCTATIVLALGDRAIMGHIGDSSLYIFRNDSLYKLSDDHTLARELVHRGVLSPEDAEDSAYSNKLTRSLGRNETILVDTLLFDLLPGDMLILCSDGLSNYLTDRDDYDELLDPDNPDYTVNSLINFANCCGGKDNISVIAIEVRHVDSDDAETMRRNHQVESAVNIIKHTLPFSNMPYRNLLQLTQISIPRVICDGFAISEAGKPAEGFYIIAAGTLRFDGENHDSRNKCLGLEALLDGYRPSKTVEAAGRCDVLYFPLSLVERLLNRSPRLGMRIYRNLAAMLVQDSGIK